MPVSARLTELCMDDPTDAEAERMRLRVQALMRTWLHTIELMEAYELGFACRLAACTTLQSAIAESEQWARHRIDSIRSMESQLLDVWVAERRRGGYADGAPAPGKPLDSDA